MNKLKTWINLKFILLAIMVVAVIVFSFYAPAKLSQFQDKTILEVVQIQEGDNSPESVRYSLNTTERLYILSMALNNRNILQSDYAASLREKAIRTNRDDAVASIAFVENSHGATKNELSAQAAMEICNTELANIIKDSLDLENFKVMNTCRQTLYSAVDMLEPQKNVSVWLIEYDTNIPPVGLPFSLMEAYIDAETGKIYGFAFRANEKINFDIDKLAKIWLESLNINNFDDITEDVPFMEESKKYKKFAIESNNNKKIVFTVGFYEGINEFFVSINQ